MYIFQLKQKDHFRILTVFHILIALILFFDCWNTGEEDVKGWMNAMIFFTASFTLFIIAIFSKTFIRKLSGHLSLLLVESVLLSVGGIYFWGHGLLLVALAHILIAGVIVLSWLYFKRRREGEKIIITEKNIILPGKFTARVILWNNLSNLIKKDDLLTLDFKNNKLMQAEIINPDEIDEVVFNLFCRQQLAAQKN